MAKAPLEAPRPWVDDTSVSGEGHLGELFRSVAQPEALSAAALAQIHARLNRPKAQFHVQRRFREATLAGIMLLAGSSLAIAGWGVSDWWSGRAGHAAAQASAASAVGSTALRAARPPAHRLRNTPAVVPTEPSGERAAEAKEAVQLPALAIASSVGGALPSAASNSSALAAESAALEGALVKLRREHNPQGALLLLDRSDALFARGALALEARVARVDALLALGRQREALAILERLPFAQVGRGGELHVLRAELRAGSDCALALADFDMLTTQPLAPPLAERALYGRAACELRVGDATHAQSDFIRYLSQFPHGRFQAQVRQELARSSGKAP